MAFDSVFMCSRKICSLRSGFLGEFLAVYYDWLFDLDFKKGTVRSHLANVSHLDAYLIRRRE